MDYHQLKLICEKVYNISLEIADLIEKKAYEEVLPIVSRRDNLSVQLGQMLKSVPNQDELPEDIKELILNIKNKEEKNLEQLVTIKQDLRKQLDQTTKSSKLISAYSNEIIGSSLIDIKE